MSLFVCIFVDVNAPYRGGYNFIDMEEIKFDTNNFRKHSDTNKKLINKSLRECGAGRSVLVDNEGSLIAGNGVYEQAQALGIPVRIVESDGRELVVVKRTDLQTDDAKRKKLALADNAVSDKVEWDFEQIKIADLDFNVEDWGIKFADDKDDNNYSRKIEAPVYEPTMSEKPNIDTLVNTDKYEELTKRIQTANISDDVKKFLLFASARFLRFDYKMIAEYYAHEKNEEIRELFENLALVIVDYEKAIESGFVCLTDELISFIKDEYDDEE